MARPSLTKALRPIPLWAETDDFLWLDSLLHLDEVHGIAKRLIEGRTLGNIERDLKRYSGAKTRAKRQAVLERITGRVLGNALYGYLKEKPVAYSRSNARKAKHPYWDELKGLEEIASPPDLALVVDSLEAEGLLDNFKAPQNSSLSYVSMFRAKPKLIALLRKAMPFDIGGLLSYEKKAVSFVTLKDYKPSEIRLCFGETEETKRLETLGRHWASVNAMYRTSHPDERLFSWEWFKRSHFAFRGDWYYLGRLYHNLSEWPLEKRSLITVDGEATVEWDFKALHINLLYSHFQGKLCTGDAYSIPHYPYNVDKVMGRKLAKVVCNVGAINSSSIVEAVRNVNGAIYGYVDDDTGKWIAPRSFELRDWLKREGIGVTRDVIQTFVNHHKDVEEFLFRGNGLVLQRMDSSILTRVLSSFSDAAMWIVPFHDSFRVKASNESKLIEEMRKAFKEETGILLPYSYVTKK